MNSGFPQYLIAAYFHAPRLQAISLPDGAIQFFTVDGALRSMLRVRMKLPHYTLYLNQQVDIHSLICNLVPQVPMLNYYSPGGRSWIVREYAVCNLFHSHTVGVRSMHLWRSDEALLTYIYMYIYAYCSPKYKLCGPSSSSNQTHLICWKANHTFHPHLILSLSKLFIFISPNPIFLPHNPSVKRALQKITSYR